MLYREYKFLAEDLQLLLNVSAFNSRLVLSLSLVFLVFTFNGLTSFTRQLHIQIDIVWYQGRWSLSFSLSLSLSISGLRLPSALGVLIMPPSLEYFAILYQSRANLHTRSHDLNVNSAQSTSIYLSFSVPLSLSLSVC